jgi:hypothetical protein
MCLIGCPKYFWLYFQPLSGTIREKAAQLCINYEFISGIYAQYVFRYVCNMGIWGNHLLVLQIALAPRPRT